MGFSGDLRRGAVVVAITLAVMGLVASVTGANSVDIGGVSAVMWCAAISLGIQWLAWIPASLKRTERFYDLVGGLTYIAVIIFSLWAGSQSEPPGPRELIVSVLVVIWSLRLSSFLFMRIHRTGKDGRFDDLKTSPARFIIPWSLQGLWVFVTLIVVVVINSQSGPSPSLSIWDGIGVTVWLIGFGIEVLADSQKTSFNEKPENSGKWIDEGLWSRSRHPNYLGEVLLWAGIACFGIACFEELEMVAWISPLFVYLLLTKISGVPILDERGLEKWGDDPDYQRYRSETPALIPHLRARER
jgi:steroid 5-alpha reductase family enzyme|tara:strand:- start:604 stop:1503 length:900 start_codon:yes stop_codon:yes gene_type:complete